MKTKIPYKTVFLFSFLLLSILLGGGELFGMENMTRAPEGSPVNSPQKLLSHIYNDYNGKFAKLRKASVTSFTTCWSAYCKRLHDVRDIDEDVQKIWEMKMILSDEFQDKLKCLEVAKLVRNNSLLEQFYQRYYQYSYF